MAFSRWVTVAAVAVLAAGCAPPRSELLRPRDGRAGLQVTGTVEGRHLAVNDGLPDLVVGDCDPPSGPDDDVCFVTADLDGELVVVAFENPQVITSGATLPVGAPDCVDPGCDDVAGSAVVDVQVGVEARIRATGGSVTFQTVEPFLRYAGTINLELPSGRLSGRFDVIPPPDEDAATGD